MHFEQAFEVLRAFEREGVRYVLIGSMAMAAQGLLRATEDVDLFVDPTDRNVEAIKRALRSVFDDPSIDEIATEDLVGSYAVVRYLPPDESMQIDLVPRLGEAFVFADIEHEEYSIGDLSIRVATPSMLYRMKRDTVRPQDRVDAERIRTRFDLEE